jgi:hypothetical protein
MADDYLAQRREVIQLRGKVEAIDSVLAARYADLLTAFEQRYSPIKTVTSMALSPEVLHRWLAEQQEGS